jgi:diacylglycerol kinase (ATP)
MLPLWKWRRAAVTPAKMKNRPFHERLGFALAGLKAGWHRERSFRTHAVFAALAALALVILQPPPLWWGLVAVVIALVMAFELVNSAMETIIDLLHPDRHPEIKVVKDMVAGAVLTISLAALVVALALVIEAGPAALARFGFSV